MAREQIILGALTIPRGAAASNPLDLHKPPGAVEVLTIFTPPVVTGGVVQIEVSAQDGAFRPLMYKGVEVQVSKADRAYSVPVPACRQLRVVSDMAEADVRVFHVVALLEVG